MVSNASDRSRIRQRVNIEHKSITKEDTGKPVVCFFHRPRQLSETEFHQQSFRCGRILSANGSHMWRWTGFHFGTVAIRIRIYYIFKLFLFRKKQMA